MILLHKLKLFTRLKAVLAVVFFSYFTQLVQAQTLLRFTLNKTCKTSASAYRTDGTLVRALWKNVTYGAGSHQVQWDGLDNAGQAVPKGAYRVKIIAHNVQYTWEGVIGNTSASWTDNIWHGLITMQDFCVSSAGQSYAAIGYNEGMPGLLYNPTGTVQAPRKVLPADFYDSYCFVRTDGTYLYAVTNNSGWDHLASSFVVRFKQADKSPAPWSSGQLAVYAGAHKRPGVVSLQQAPELVNYDPNNTTPLHNAWLANRITGLAVGSTYLAVARKAQNQVRFYATATGAILGSLSIASPGQIAFAANGDLWVITAGQVKCYAVDGGAHFRELRTLTGIVAPLALDSHPTQNLLVVADGGNSQQLKAYTTTGTLQWTYGRPGGYPALGPEVSVDKLWFQVQDPLSMSATDRDRYGDPFTFVKWSPDGTLWVLDTANLRALHLGADRTYLEQIMYLPDRLSLAGDQRDATRVFSGNLEFRVGKAPLQPGSQSQLTSPTWELVNNWGAGINVMRYTALVNVATHANGRTYAQVHDNSTDNAGYKGARTALVELLAKKPLRFTGIVLEDYGNGGYSFEQMPTGELVCGRLDYDKYAAVKDVEIKCEKRALLGYDESHNPQYGPVETIWAIRTKLDRGSDPYFNKPVGARLRLPRTGSGHYVTYQPRRHPREGDYHLGTVAPGATNWTTKFHHGKVIQRPDGQGSYPEIEAYGGWDGGNVYADGKDIIALYNGQNNSASNNFYHFTQDGLLIGEFGERNDQNLLTDAYSPAGIAGNNVDMYMVRAGQTLYAYTVDESAHAGLHRWRIDGTADIQELTGTGALGTLIQVGAWLSQPTNFYYQGGTPASAVATLTNWSSLPNGDGSAPTTFQAPNQLFHLARPTAGQPIQIDGDLLQGGTSRLVVGDPGAEAPVQVVITTKAKAGEASTPMPIDVERNGALEIQGFMGTLPALGRLAASSVVTYNTPRTDILLGRAGSSSVGTLRLTGGSVAHLRHNLTVQGELILMQGGTLHLDGYDATIVAPHLVSGDALSYIHTAGGGALWQTVSASNGHSSVFYPIGQSTYNPAWLSQTNAGATDLFGVAVSDSTYANYAVVAPSADSTRGAGYGVRGVGTPITSSPVGAARTWYLREAVKGGASLSLKLQNTFVNQPVTKAVFVSQYHVPTGSPEGTTATWEANARDQLGVQLLSNTPSSQAYTAARVNITDSAPFTLSAPHTPLPVELTSFTATRRFSAAVCIWETASEINCAYFLVERSINGTDFDLLGRVAGATNSIGKRSYSYLDTQPPAIRCYYRLRQVDTDGVESFSPVATIDATHTEEGTSTVSVVPNPSSGQFTIDSSAVIQEINVYDALGRCVKQSPLSSSISHVSLDLTSHPTGVYMLHVRTTDSYKIIKINKIN